MSSRIVQTAADRAPQLFGHQPATPRARVSHAPRMAASAPVKAAAPQFGGIGKVVAGSSDGLISLFQKITEIYLVGFLAIDVVALWITRIIKGLTRGAEKYDAAKDPENEGLPPSQVLRKSFRKNMQGLNWLNALEEALREVITGPSGFVVPAVTFSLASRKFAKSAVEMGYGPLTQMKNSYATYLKNTGLADGGEISPARLRESYRDFMRNTLKADDEMLARTINVQGTPYGRHNGQTFAQYIDDWTERWVNTASKSLDKDLPKAERKAVRAALEKLNSEFETIVEKGHNIQVRLGDRLREGNHITARLADKAGDVKTASKPLDELLTSFTRFKDFAREAAKSNKAGASFGEAIEKTYRKLVGKKFAFALLATFAASSFLYIVPRISQRNKHYPANRLLMEGGGAENASGANTEATAGKKPEAGAKASTDTVGANEHGVSDADLAQLLQALAPSSPAPVPSPNAFQPVLPPPAFQQPQPFVPQPIPFPQFGKNGRAE